MHHFGSDHTRKKFSLLSMPGAFFEVVCASVLSKARLGFVGFVIGIILAFVPGSMIHANGVPVQIFLDYLPFKSTWEPARNGNGVAIVAANDEMVRVQTQKLPAPPEGHGYFAWLEQTDGGYLPVGELNYQPDGTASITQRIPDLPYSENFAWVLVTVEALEGQKTIPSDDVALAGRLPNPLALPVGSEEAPDLLPVTGGEQFGGNGILYLLPMLFLIGILYSVRYLTRVKVSVPEENHEIRRKSEG